MRGAKAGARVPGSTGTGGNARSLPRRESAAAEASGSVVIRKSTPAPGLHLVATPIGHLDDITLRAIAVLGGADLIACEDTRVTRVLLDRLGIAGAALVAVRDDNEAAVAPRIMARLAEGAVVALVSDAGSPLVSDPGYRLVAACRAAGHPVHVVPGPSAVIAALQLAGLPTDRFLFAGFLPSRGAARQRALAELAPVPATLVLFESPHRLRESLADMGRVLGEREAAVVREITKRFEEVRRGRLGELARAYAGEEAPRGEIVVVVAPPEPAAAAEGAALDARLRAALAEASLRAAVDKVAAETGLSRKAVYARALALSREDG